MIQPDDDLGPDEIEARSKQLAESLLDAFAQHGPTGLKAAANLWRAMAKRLPTLVMRRKALLTLRMALERITHP